MDKGELKYYEEKLNEIPKDIVKKAVKFLQEYLYMNGWKDEIKELIEYKGLIEWGIPTHSMWGMDVRNALRSKANLLDDLLPDGNWDDYYIQCIEVALGKREYTYE